MLHGVGISSAFSAFSPIFGFIKIIMDGFQVV
jgi:hypothetical protein